MSGVLTQRAFFTPFGAWDRCSMTEANGLLVDFDHYLGPCRRPFGMEGWAFILGGRPVGVAVSASAVSPTIPTHAGHDPRTEPCTSACRVYARGEVVELARLATAERWMTRVVLRLWREVAGPAWSYWTAEAAVAYSANKRHPGHIYHTDGWERQATNAGSDSGNWSKPPRVKTDAAHGTKTLWLWRYTA